MTYVDISQIDFAIVIFRTQVSYRSAVSRVHSTCGVAFSIVVLKKALFKRWNATIRLKSIIFG